MNVILMNGSEFIANLTNYTSHIIIRPKDPGIERDSLVVFVPEMLLDGKEEPYIKIEGFDGDTHHIGIVRVKPSSYYYQSDIITYVTRKPNSNELIYLLK